MHAGDGEHARMRRGEEQSRNTAGTKQDQPVVSYHPTEQQENKERTHQEQTPFGAQNARFTRTVPSGHFVHLTFILERLEGVLSDALAPLRGGGFPVFDTTTR